jgi:hypothetical protein
MFKPIRSNTFDTTPITILPPYKKLSYNPNAINILFNDLKIDNTISLSITARNPNILDLLMKLDYNAMKLKCQPFCQDLVSYVLHPDRVSRISSSFGLDYDDYFQALGF